LSSKSAGTGKPEENKNTLARWLSSVFYACGKSFC
jgi:hypothetical protein